MGDLCLILHSVTGCQIQLLTDEITVSASSINWKSINMEEEWGIEQLVHYSNDDLSREKLLMMPRTASWFGGYRGPLLYREVSGSFVFTTVYCPESISTTTAVDSNSYQ